MTPAEKEALSRLLPKWLLQSLATRLAMAILGILSLIATPLADNIPPRLLLLLCGLQFLAIGGLLWHLRRVRRSLEGERDAAREEASRKVWRHPGGPGSW